MGACSKLRQLHEASGGGGRGCVGPGTPAYTPQYTLTAARREQVLGHMWNPVQVACGATSASRRAFTTRGKQLQAQPVVHLSPHHT